MQLVSLFIIICSFFSGNAMEPMIKLFTAHVEKATLVDKNLTLSAKLDTGAKSSSLSAINIQEVEENGKTYLRYTF